MKAVVRKAASHPVATDLGRAAALGIQDLLARHNDHVCCGIEWYRGFCEALDMKPDSRVEDFIRREIIQREASDLGLPVRVFETVALARKRGRKADGS